MGCCSDTSILEGTAENMQEYAAQCNDNAEPMQITNGTKVIATVSSPFPLCAFFADNFTNSQ